MQPNQIRLKMSRSLVSTAAAILLSLFLTGIAAAQGEGSQGDTYLDPLAYTRINSTAEGIPLTVKYQATGETRRAMGRYLLTDSREMYLRSASLATILKAGRYWQGELRHLDLKVGTETFRVTAGSRVVLSGDGERLLPVPVLSLDGGL